MPAIAEESSVDKNLVSCSNKLPALAIYWNMIRGFYQHSTLPQSLASMILYTVAERGHCQYCSSSHELTCRTLGIDEATLSALAQDLSHVSPQRIRAIIE